MEKYMQNNRPEVCPHRTHFHQAVILRGNKILAVAHNSVGSRHKGCGYSDGTIHAERAVVKKLGDFSELRGTTLLVYRYNSQGELRNSKPCYDCELFLTKCIKEYGLRKVIYSVQK